MSSKFESVVVPALIAANIPIQETKRIIINICHEFAGTELVVPKKPLYESRNEQIKEMQGNDIEVGDKVHLSDRQIRRIRNGK